MSEQQITEKNVLQFIQQQPKTPLSLLANTMARLFLRRPLTLQQSNLMGAYQKINPEHYEKIERHISLGMCYGYTIYWLATMRATHERKLLRLDNTNFTPEDAHFFNVIDILNKYHQNPKSIPEDTKEHLEKAFDRLAYIQSKQSPTSFFKSGDNFFVASLPEIGTRDEGYFYKELIAVLSTFEAGTCIQILVPRHAIGCYVGENHIYLLDPNNENIILIKKSSSKNNAAKISMFCENDQTLLSEISNTFNIYYDNSEPDNTNDRITTNKIISFHTLTELNQTQLEKVQKFNTVQLSCIPDIKNDKRLKEKINNVHTMISNQLISDDYKVSLISKLCTKIQETLDDKNKHLSLDDIDSINDLVVHDNKRFLKLFFTLLRKPGIKSVASFKLYYEILNDTFFSVGYTPEKMNNLIALDSEQFLERVNERIESMVKYFPVFKLRGDEFYQKWIEHTESITKAITGTRFCHNEKLKDIINTMETYNQLGDDKPFQKAIDNLQNTIEANKDYQSPKPGP